MSRARPWQELAPLSIELVEIRVEHFRGTTLRSMRGHLVETGEPEILVNIAPRNGGSGGSAARARYSRALKLDRNPRDPQRVASLVDLPGRNRVFGIRYCLVDERVEFLP